MSQHLLRVSLRFARSQDGAIVDRIVLRGHDGVALVTPFADPPIWSDDGRTLTLLLDPSRQKAGLAGHRAAGYVLAADSSVALELDGHVLKRWQVRRGECPPLQPRRWRPQAVRAGSRDALVVRFAGPVDVLSEPLLAVASPPGRRFVGIGRLRDAERTWAFTLSHPWPRDAQLAVHPRFEDPCGDEPGERFEHAPGAGLGSSRRTTWLPIPIVGRRKGRS